MSALEEMLAGYLESETPEEGVFHTIARAATLKTSIDNHLLRSKTHPADGFLAERFLGHGLFPVASLHGRYQVYHRADLFADHFADLVVYLLDHPVSHLPIVHHVCHSVDPPVFHPPMDCVASTSLLLATTIGLSVAVLPLYDWYGDTGCGCCGCFGRGGCCDGRIVVHPDDSIFDHAMSGCHHAKRADHGIDLPLVDWRKWWTCWQGNAGWYDDYSGWRSFVDGSQW